jgi:hypothetical protein
MATAEQREAMKLALHALGVFSAEWMAKHDAQRLVQVVLDRSGAMAINLPTGMPRKAAANILRAALEMLEREPDFSWETGRPS